MGTRDRDWGHGNVVHSWGQGNKIGHIAIHHGGNMRTKYECKLMSSS